MALAVTLTGCGLLSGSDDESPSPASGDSKLETTDLTVSIMKTTDLAPFHLAMQEGFFEDEGLKVKFVDSPSGGESVGKMISGEADIAYSSYTPFFLAESKQAAKGVGGIKLVADAAFAGPGSTMLVALPNSSVKSVKDLAGKRIAVTAPNTISDLMTKAVMKTNNVDFSSVKWTPTPFPAMASRLAAGEVDAAFVTEPFIQDTGRKAGAMPVVDAATGPTADLPVAGWASTGDFVKKNPKTIAAFQRAMQKGTDLALKDRSKVEPMLVKFSGVDEDTAKMATLLTFQSKLDATRVQRVPDLMLEFSVIKAPIDVSKMVVSSSSSK